MNGHLDENVANKSNLSIWEWGSYVGVIYRPPPSNVIFHIPYYYVTVSDCDSVEMATFRINYLTGVDY
jgi:hypothetical protein